jgi:tetratricopeptide (TPR) repeat protein
LSLSSLSLFGQRGSGLDYYVDAENFRRSSKFEEAIYKYELAIQKEPTNHIYIYQKAQCEYQTKRTDIALRSLMEVVKIKEDFVPAYLLMARIARVNNKSADVVAYYDKAARHEKDLNKKISYKLLSMSRLIKLKDVKGAYARVRDAYSLNAEDTTVLYFYAKLSNQMQQYEDARNSMLKAESKIAHFAPEAKAKYYFELGYAHYHLEEYPQALNAWNNAQYGSYKVRIEKYLPKYLANIAAAYMRMFEDSLSYVYASKASQIQKDYALAHVILIELSKRKVEQHEAIALELKAANVEPNVFKKKDWYYKIVEKQILADKFDDAHQLTGQLLAMDNKDLRAIFLRMLSLYRQKEYPAVIRGLQEQLALPMDANYRANYTFLLGLAARRAGNKELALASFKKVLPSIYGNAAEVEMNKLLKSDNNTDDDDSADEVSSTDD